MPKKTYPLSHGQQSERFKKAVRDLVDAGDLDVSDEEAIANRMKTNVKAQKGA